MQDNDGAFEIKNDDVNLASLEILSHLFARQDALIYFLLKKLTDNDEEFAKESKALYKMYQKGVVSVYERIYENYGHVDLGRLFGNQNDEESL